MSPAISAAAPRSDRGDGSIWSPDQRELRWRAVLFCTLELLCPWATVGFPLLVGAVLIQQGFRTSDSLLYVGVAMFGPSMGVLLLSVLIDRVERWKALAFCAGLMAAIGLGFAASGSAAMIMTAGLAFQMLAAIYIVSMNVYTAEAFPTRVRAVVSSTAWSVNRVTSALVPLALLPLLRSSGALVMFSVIAAVLILSTTLLSVFGPRGLTGRSLR
jgi:putative MFS transporter